MMMTTTLMTSMMAMIMQNTENPALLIIINYKYNITVIHCERPVSYLVNHTKIENNRQLLNSILIKLRLDRTINAGITRLTNQLQHADV